MSLTMFQRRIFFTLDCLALSSIFYLFIFLKMSDLHLVPEGFDKKRTVWKGCVKNHLKIFLIILCGIPYTQKDHLCFYKNSTNQTFISNSSKVVYFRKHLSCQVQHLQKTTFPLPLNVPYTCKTITFAVGTIAESLHT